MIGSRQRQVSRASEQDLVRQVVTSQVMEGVYRATISDYWERVVCSVFPEYSAWSFTSGNSRVLCPFHEDKKPSLGLVKDSKGIEVFNCFGCGAKGTVWHFHKLFYRRYMTGYADAKDKDLIERLAHIFGVELVRQIDKKEERASNQVDFSQGVVYNVGIHKENVALIKRQFQEGLIDEREFRFQLALLSEKVMEVMRGSQIE